MNSRNSILIWFFSVLFIQWFLFSTGTFQWQVTRYDKALDMWEPESDISTAVVKVNLTQNDGKHISSDVPFQITFENTNEVVYQNASANFSLIGNNTIMFYHALNVSGRDATGGAVIVDIAVSKSKQPPNIYWKIGKVFFVGYSDVYHLLASPPLKNLICLFSSFLMNCFLITGTLPAGDDNERIEGDGTYILPVNASGMHYLGLSITNLGTCNA